MTCRTGHEEIIYDGPLCPGCDIIIDKGLIIGKLKLQIVDLKDKLRHKESKGA